MSASLNQTSRGETLEALRAAIRDQGTWTEERAVAGLQHALELTGGARHRAVTLGTSLVAGARARRDERPFWTRFSRSSAFPIRKESRSCASPRRC